jgi:hypothetical protein
MHKNLIKPCTAQNLLPQPSQRVRQPIILAPSPSPQHNTIRIYAIVTADNDGTHSATIDHQDSVNAKCGYKYRIEKEDIKKLVDWANLIFAAANIEFLFDPDKDLEIRHDTLLNHDSLTSRDVTVDTQHVFYCSGDGNIHELWAGNKWQFKNISEEASAPSATGSPAVYATGASRFKHVVYRGVDGHIHELFAGDAWQFNTITIQANAPQAAGDPFGYTTFDSTTGRMDVQHVVYRGVDEHIHELFAGDSWQHNDLTSLVGAPHAADDPVAYTTNDYGFGVIDDQHIVYRGVDGHIHELFTIDTWQHNDLTTLSNAPLAVGDPTAYTDSAKRDQHIIYRDTKNHIHELFARSVD